MRPLKDSELFALRWFAARVDELQRDSLLKDLQHASAREIRDDQLLIEFDLAGYSRPESAARRAMPIDAAVLDADGALLNVALSTDENGRLLDLEVLRFDEKPVAGPDWSTLRLRRPGEVLRLNEVSSPVRVESRSARSAVRRLWARWLG